MPRVSILDTILNRPSQSYAAPEVEPGPHRGRKTSSDKWAAPPDLPSAPRAPSSILSGGMFGRRKSSKMGSDAGTSVAGSTTSRFGRKKRFSKAAGDGSRNGDEMASQYAPSSVADDSFSKRKSKWWETGSMTFGRRSRAPSIAGDSVFSEPAERFNGMSNNWSSMAGIGSGATANRTSRSEQGASPGRRSANGTVPPVPQVDRRYLNGAPPGRLQSNVAPLGSSSLNPSLNPRASKQRLSTSGSQNSIKKSGSSNRLSSPSPMDRIASPPPSHYALPPSRVSSPPPRPLSPTFSDSGRSVRSTGSNSQNRAQDWRNFVQSMSHSDISKNWQQSQSHVSNIDAAIHKVNAVPGTERRKSNVMRLQKELQQEAQYEQTLRDPGVIHQDLLTRAANQVVGLPPGGSAHGDADLLGHRIRPGSIVLTSSTPVAERARSPAPHPQQAQMQQYADQQQQQQHRQSPEQQQKRQLSPVSSHTREELAKSFSPPPSSRMPLPVASARTPPQTQAMTLPAAPTPNVQAQESSEEDTSSEEEDDEEEEKEEEEGEGEGEEGEEEEEEAEVDEGEGQESSSEESDESEESQRRLEAVNEEDEEGSSSVGHEMRPHTTLVNSTAPKYKAFEDILAKSAAGTSQASPPIAIASYTTPDLRLNGNAVHDTTPESALQEHAQQADTGKEKPKEDVVVSSDTVMPARRAVVVQNAAERPASDDSSSSSEESEVKEKGDEEKDAQPVEKEEETQGTEQTSVAKTPAIQTKSSADTPDSRSIRTVQTGRGTVTFDQQIEDKGAADDASVHSDATASRPKSATASIRSGSRPPTLSRRLSDLSLGTSFGVNASLLRGASRASSRGIRLTGDDADSIRSLSDDEVDADTKEKIKQEQERLRGMKVGEDFFGGSLSSILDRFGASKWDNDENNTIGKLDLDVGTSRPAEGKPFSTQEILSMNAQERINEVRRQRSESPTALRSNRDSDAMTMQSGVAPSFAAIWLLNQADDSPALTESKPTPESSPSNTPEKKGHLRQKSTASSENNHVSASSRLRNFFSGGGNGSGSGSGNGIAGNAAAEKPLERKTSVMDRPRQRKAKPKEMGGVPISQGKLLAEERAEVKEDTRSTFPELIAAMQDKREAQTLPQSASSTSLTSAVEVQPMSKDKPAPKKSALKPKKQKSLADTLFSFSSPEKKAEKKRRNSEAKKVELAMKSMPSDDKLESGRQTPPPPSLSSTDSIYTTPEKGLRGESAENSPQQETKLSSYHTARDFGGEERDYAPEKGEAEESKEVMRTEEPKESISQSETKAPNQQSGPVQEGQNASSDIGSPESTSSTALTTPGSSVVAEKESIPQIMAIAPKSPPRLDKKLPMPPVPTFEQGVVLSPPEREGEVTPLAQSRSDPIESDQNKTPVAETNEPPSFGISIIPPTPPALESRGSYTSSTSKATLMSAAPEAVMEQAEEETNAVPSNAGPSNLQRSSSSKIKSSDVSRKASKKKKKSDTEQSHGEHQVQGLSLPKGLVATTVASSAPRQNQQHATSDTSLDANLQRKKSKGSKASPRLSRSYLDTSTPAALDSPSSPRSSSALRQSLAEAPPVPMVPASPSLNIPSSRSETNSSVGSERVTSHGTPSPARSVSSRSALSSSAASLNLASEVLQQQQQHQQARVPRTIRTLTAGPNGHARSSLMSAISETGGDSPVDVQRSRSPMPTYLEDSPVAGSLGDLSQNQSQSSLGTRSPSPTIDRRSVSGPLAGTATSISHAASSRAESSDGHGLHNRSWRSSYMSAESDMSGFQAQSIMSLPSAPQGQTSYKAKEPPKMTSAIDDRLYAKTTMSTISVTSGAFRSKSLRRRKSNADMQMGGNESARHSRTSIDMMPEGLMEELQRTQMTLTAHTPPPRKLSSTQVLVQVVTCAIDEIDRQLLREKVKAETAYGFVPGRSFCGRIMETGWEVKRMRKGDLVFGLQSSRKCGALAEFMTIDQNLIAKAPEECLTTEEIAALPSVGVMAYQLMEHHCSQLKRGSRILILNAHDGAGLLTMQEASNLGLIIVAQCPTSISDGVALCEANGAHEVVIGDPLWALNSLHESSFDLIIDTVGGRRVYDAARRILAFEGEFVTCVGDMQSSVNPNFKSHLRSLRRSFFKKDTKRIGYEWISTDMGEDCREALDAVKSAAERGQICPRLQSILPFSEAPRAFESTLRGGFTEPGSIVVKIS